MWVSAKKLQMRCVTRTQKKNAWPENTSVTSLKCGTYLYCTDVRGTSDYCENEAQWLGSRIFMSG
jgi:hypothetical protein